jgi:hypothetical protein
MLWSVRVRGKGGKKDMLIPNSRRRDETSRGQGIGKNLGVKGARQRQIERERERERHKV